MKPSLIGAFLMAFTPAIAQAGTFSASLSLNVYVPVEQR
jgi:hypothetical protein